MFDGLDQFLAYIGAVVCLVVVIGGAHSNNTHELVRTCSRYYARVFHVQTEDDLRVDWFRGAETVGITAGTSTSDALIEAVEEWLYAKKRIQFGVPIAQHQAVQFMLADMAKDIEAARLLVWKAAWLADQGIRNSKEAAMAKALAADIAMQVTTNAVQIYGGIGYTKWHPLEKLMRDAKVIQIYEGTAQIMRLIIARQLLQETEKTLY